MIVQTKLIEYASSENINLQIYEKNIEKVEINTLNDKLELFQTSNVSSYILKSIIDGKSINMATDSISDPKKIVTTLKSIASLQENNEQNILASDNIKTHITKPQIVDYNQVKVDLLKLNDLKSKYKEIVNIECMYEHYNNIYKLTNSNVSLEDDIYLNAYGVNISVSLNDLKKTGFYTYYSKDYDINSLINYLEEEIPNLILKLNEQPVITNKYNIILKNNVVTDILNTFASGFQSKSIAQKTSVFTNKLNEKIASPNITIKEDPQNSLVPRYFDYEGTPTTKKTIVDKGIFKNSLNDLEYALKNKEKPTGNADGVNNLYIVSGNNSFNDLLKELNNGIVISEVYGLHSGVDTKSGIISIQASGYYVENGELTAGIDTSILATNIFELLNNVKSVGNDTSLNSLEVHTPSLLIENITITGKGGENNG